MAVINPFVEGDIDEAVAIRLIRHTGHDAGTTYGRRGIGYIKDKISAFNRSAGAIRYLTLVDLMDTGFACPPDVLRGWLPHPGAQMQLRVVVREIESWLLADTDGKQTLVNVARRSRRRSVRTAIVPSPQSTAPVGAQYNSELRAFVDSHWDPDRARTRSPSLAKCIDRLAAVPV